MWQHEGEGVARIFNMNLLTAFGLLAVSSMLVFYALEKRSSWFTLAFAGSCLLASAYGFLQGAWPFGFVEFVWSIVALRKWWHALTEAGAKRHQESPITRPVSTSKSTS
jgi:hypothetical protein